MSDALFIRRIGHGARQVLALHCTIAHSGAWRGLGEEVADDMTLIAPDMLSHGRSPDWDETGDFQDRSIAALEPLLREPMDLLGHSFGATLALRLAVEHPDLVRSLTLVEPVLFAIVVADDPDLLAEHDRRATPYLEALKAGEREQGARLFNRMWGLDGPRWPDLPEGTRAAMVRGIHVMPASSPAVYDDHAGVLKPDALARVRMPVLLLRGSKTDPVIATVNDGLARRLPHARNHVVEGAGHMLPISHPREMAQELRALLATVPV